MMYGQRTKITPRINPWRVRRRHTLVCINGAAVGIATSTSGNVGGRRVKEPPPAPRIPDIACWKDTIRQWRGADKKMGLIRHSPLGRQGCITLIIVEYKFLQSRDGNIQISMAMD